MKVIYHSLFFLILWSSTSLLKAHEPTEFFEIIDIKWMTTCDPNSTEPDEGFDIIVKGTKKSKSPYNRVLCVVFDKEGNEIGYGKATQDNYYTDIWVRRSCFDTEGRPKIFHSAKCFDPDK